MTQTGKAMRRQFGTRYAAKRAKARKPKRKLFGTLPISMKAGNGQRFALRGER
jgi:hypothetical protein